MDTKDSGQKRGRQTGFEKWGGYMAAKKQKLGAQYKGQKFLELANHGIEGSEIFKGVSIFVNGYTKPSAEELKKLMLVHGGAYYYYYSSTHTTHIVASNLPDSKIRKLKDEKIVSPNWITDSIKVGKLLPYSDYLLYIPGITKGQQKLCLKKKIAVGSNVESTVPNEMDKEFENHQTDLISDDNHIDYNEKPLGSDSQTTLRNCSIINTNMNMPPILPLSELSDSTRILSKVPPSDSLDKTVLSEKKSSESGQRSGMCVKAGDPQFLSEFYSHSRLHHISTAGQELKQYVQQLALTQKHKGFPGREKLHLLKEKLLESSCRNNDLNRLNYQTFSDDNAQLNKETDFKSESDSLTIKPRNAKVIMHIDMDCFFVSVGLRQYPELKGQPVAVTHSRGRRVVPQPGSNAEYEYNYYKQRLKQKSCKLEAINESKEVEDILSSPNNNLNTNAFGNSSAVATNFGSLSEIASCSYEARETGIRNGMFLGQALKLCPNLKTIPYDFEGYTQVSRQLYDSVSKYSLDIEAVSCDELYVDCTEVLSDTKVSPLQFASILREDIRNETGCTASAGLGSNMLMARLATRVAKPNGHYFLPITEVEDFMKRQPIDCLPGVGRTMASRLKHLGVNNCGDLQTLSLSRLQQEFGPKTGQTLFDYCRGIDDRAVSMEKDRKSVSAEINYGIRFQQEKEVFDFLNELAQEVHQRLKKINRIGRMITLKLKIRKPDSPTETAKFMGHGVCDSISKSVNLPCATDDPLIIGKECCLLTQAMKVKPQDFRGIGIQIGRLESVADERKTSKSIKQFMSKVSPLKEATDNSVFCEKTRPVVTETKEDSIKHLLMKSSPSNNNVINNYINISPDQLDESVLKALPEDLRQEVLSMYGRKNEKSPSKSSILGSVKSPTAAQRAQIGYPLDESVLKALPEDLRQEVLSMYGRKNEKSPSKSSILGSVKSPTAARCGRIGYIRRKKKLSPKSSPQKVPQNRNGTLFPYAIETSRNAEQELPIIASPPKASLGGAVCVDEVRDMMKEWVQSTEQPSEEDSEQFRNYVLSVIEEKDLEKVDLIVKHFYRLVSAASHFWKETYLTVLSYVQQKMLQDFDHMLKVSSDF